MSVGLYWRPLRGEHREGGASPSFMDLKEKEHVGSQMFGALFIGVCMVILFRQEFPYCQGHST